MRVGIAFEGGGAKGSFGWAVLEVLEQHGIRPAAVSGTSAGALSAIAVASGDIKLGSELYRSLRAPDILPFHLPLVFGLPLFAFCYAAHAFRRFCSGRAPSHLDQERSLLDTVLRCLFIVAIVGPLIPLLYVGYVPRPRPGVHEVGPLGALATLIVLALVFARSQNYLMRVFGTYWLVYCFVFFVAMLLFDLPKKLWHREVPIDWVFLRPYFFMLCPLLWYGTLHLLAWALAQVPLTSNAPLRTHVRRFLGQGLKMPCYVAVAEVQDVHDPDNPTYVGQESVDGIVIGKPLALPIPRHVPEYLRLNDHGLEDQVRYSVASAALPFGIVSPERIGRREFVDGGTADNCPVVPLIDAEHCDVLLTVHLRPNAPLADAATHYLEVRRLLDLGCGGGEVLDPYVAPGAPTKVPYRKLPKDWPVHFAVMPSKDLGWLLDFRRKQTQMRIDEGLKVGAQLVARLEEWARKKEQPVITTDECPTNP